MKWFSKEKTEEILTKDYEFFSDELCRMIPVEQFTFLFYYKYAGFTGVWSFAIKNNILICNGIGDFQFRFPLTPLDK